MTITRLQKLALMLPANIIGKAAKSYGLELGMNGNFEEVESLIGQMEQTGCLEVEAAELKYFLISRYVHSGKMEMALCLYHTTRTILPDLLSARINTANVLISGLLPYNFETAVKIWNDFAESMVPATIQWQWAKAGIAILAHCRRYADRKAAQLVYSQLKKFVKAETAVAFLTEAERIMKKI